MHDCLWRFMGISRCFSQGNNRVDIPIRSLPDEGWGFLVRIVGGLSCQSPLVLLRFLRRKNALASDILSYVCKNRQNPNFVCVYIYIYIYTYGLPEGGFLLVPKLINTLHTVVVKHVCPQRKLAVWSGLAVSRNCLAISPSFQRVLKATPTCPRCCLSGHLY